MTVEELAPSPVAVTVRFPGEVAKTYAVESLTTFIVPDAAGDRVNVNFTSGRLAPVCPIARAVTRMESPVTAV